MRLTAQENALITSANLLAHRVRRLMQWDALNNAEGDVAIEATREHMIAFLNAHQGAQAEVKRTSNHVLFSSIWRSHILFRAKWLAGTCPVFDMKVQ